MVIVCACFAACSPDVQNVEIVDVDYSTILYDYLEYPDEVNVASMQTKRSGAKEDPVNVKAIYESTTLTDSEKIAQMVYGALTNEIACDHFAYFRNQVGTTTIKSNSGTLVYQRLRRQSDDVKDDTTIKLPVNHNFGGTETNFVTSAFIRYVANGRYNKMTNDTDIKYDEKTGLLTVEKWKKSSDAWNKVEDAAGSRSYDEARKSVINWQAKGIVSADGAKIERKTDDKNNVYYELTFSIDVEVANADEQTIKALENDNSGKNMSFEKCSMTVEIWECGLTKRYLIDETWKGEIGALVIWYEGSASSKSEIIFSYSEKDMNYSATDDIFQSIKK